MIDTPIRKKAKNYPKDFTPPAGYLISLRNINAPPTESSISGRQSGSVSGAHIGMQAFNKSTQLAETTIQERKNIIITINPEQAARFAANTQKEETPLVNLHISRRRPYLNPQLLARPRIEEKVDEDLMDGQESQDEGTPGVIRKNVGEQKPLLAEQPNNLTMPLKQANLAQRVESNQNIFTSSLRQYPNFTNLKQKRLPAFLKVPSTQEEARSKLRKRQSSFNFSQSHFRTQKEKQRSEQKEKNQFTNLYEQNSINKLKAHINQIVYDRQKQKQKIGNTHQTQADFDIQISSKRDFHPQHTFTTRLHPGHSHHQNLNIPEDEEGQGNNWRSAYYQNKRQNTNMRTNSNPKSTGLNRKITITYKKTSLNILKQIYNGLKQTQNVEIEILIPNSLMNINLNKNTQKYELYSQSALVFESLGIPVQNLTVKRYSNCIMMLSKNICILWHYDGKIYLGSWQTKYLDEGFKHGLGLQWVPNKHLYYGEFCQGKKEGLGVMKTHDQVFIGEWSRGKRTDNGYLVSKSGEIFRGKDNFFGESQNYQSDPFL